MGDRTHVRLYVLNEQAEAAQDLFDGFQQDEDSSDEELTCFEFSEVNYGNLEFEGDLIEAGITFNKEWDSGDEYAAGTRYVRFRPDGTLQDLEVYDNGTNPDLGRLLALCDRPDELVQYIRDFHAEITPLPWDNQAEYGKCYLARQLITG